MQSQTETVVCEPATAIPGDDDGDSDGDDGTGSDCGSEESAYSFTSTSLEDNEISGDTLHAEHKFQDSKLPEDVEIWDNVHDRWLTRRVMRYDMHTDLFYGDEHWHKSFSLRRKIVKRVEQQKPDTAHALHRKGSKACPTMVCIYGVPVLLVSYNSKTDSFRAIVFGANDGRIKQSALRLYYHAGIRMYTNEKSPSLTGAVHFERRCETLGVGKHWRVRCNRHTTGGQP